MTPRLARTFASLSLLVLSWVRVPSLCAQSPTPTQAATARVAIPEGPAGNALKAWLEAFNSGDKAQMDA